MIDSGLKPRPPDYTKPVALVLQGGGALGSYQGGVYEALAGSDYLPDWVAGISIGAINAALIAGNAPERRVERLRQFWEGITTPFWPALPTIDLGSIGRQAGSLRALLFGQPGFFRPQDPAAWFHLPGPTSYYDTSPLKSTLEDLVDFDRINARAIRFSIGAVNVRTGNFAYFDNARTTIRAEHVMASGALPTGFPAIEIDGEFYWDGGLVSNTPLQYVLESTFDQSRLTFQVDLFPARGEVPDTLQAAEEREKDIRYSSRTRAVTDQFKTLHDLRHMIGMLWAKLPQEMRTTDEAQWLHALGSLSSMDIVELIYRTDVAQGQSKDYEFSRATMETRWTQGLKDARATLRVSPWLAPMPPELGTRTFDVLRPDVSALD
jgi:NTE family protein